MIGRTTCEIVVLSTRADGREDALRRVEHLLPHLRQMKTSGAALHEAHPAALFERAGVPCRISDNLEGELWIKLVWNCALNAVSGLGRAKYGQIAQVLCVGTSICHERPAASMRSMIVGTHCTGEER